MALVQTVEDLEAQSRLKVLRAREAVEDTVGLLAEDLLTGTFWLDVRKQQNPAIGFGAVTSAVWSAFHGADEERAPHTVAEEFLRTNPPATFYPDDEREPSRP
jgi:histidine ammonia-lyase